MSEKMTCPACRAHTSGVLSAYMDGRPCPHCGLTADATEQILSIRARQADAELTQRCEELTVQLDQERVKTHELATVLDEVAAAMARWRS